MAQSKTVNEFKKMRSYFTYANQLYPHVILIQFSLSIINTVRIFLNILFIGQLINLLINPSQAFMPPVLFTGLFLVALLAVNITADYLQAKSFTGMHYLNKNANTNLANKMLDVDYLTFTDSKFRDIYSSVKAGFTYTGSFMTFVSGILDGLVSFATTLVLAGGSLIFLFSTKSQDTSGFSQFANSIWFVVVAVILIIIPIIASFPLGKIQSRLFEKFYQINVSFNRTLEYYMSIVFRDPVYGKTLRLYDPKDKMVQGVIKEVDDQFTENSKIQTQSVAIGNLDTVLTFLVVAGFYLLIAIKGLTGAIAIGSVIIYVGYFQQIISSLSNLFLQWNNRRAAFKTIDQYIAFMNFDNEKTSGRDLTIPQEIQTIEFENVTYQYPGSETYAIRDLNLTIKAGERVAVVGRNGSGKTTLIKLLIGLASPTTGRILVNGKDITDFNVDDYQNLFSVVFQDFKLSAFSIVENITANSPYDKDRIKTALELAGIDEKVAQLPDGIQTPITQELSSSGVNFSGGELQKLAIARAWYKNAPVVILDEPTSALDPLSEAEMYEQFDNLIQAKTALYVSHRMSSTQFSSRIVVFDQGRLVEDGTHKTLMAEQGIYCNLFSEQAKYYQK
ncbi:ABC transporter ATP-binding protein [Holzapfeliella sp. He02]|uniref:ABC transporter ATP-binding protein n=1 Tax=Holzapfeliella saturejae TaxID=3082953 RepID=A0ABU8SHJ4_9LACO